MFKYRLQQVDTSILFQVLEQKAPLRQGFYYISSNGLRISSFSFCELSRHTREIFLRGTEVSKNFSISNCLKSTFEQAKLAKEEYSFALKEFKRNYSKINLTFQRKQSEGRDYFILKYSDIGIQGPFGSWHW